MAIPGALVRWSDSNLWTVLVLNICIPFGCISVAQWENKHRRIGKLFGSPRRAVVAFSVVLILLTIQANHIYSGLVRSQLQWYVLHDNRVLWSGYCLLIFGTLLIYKAFRALGFYSTFYGNYFGMNLGKEVTEFPYTFLSHPMYVGSTLNHLGFALIFASQVGLIVTVITAVAYSMVARYERISVGEMNKKLDQTKKKS